MVEYSERLVWAMNEAGMNVRQLADGLDASYQAVKKVVDGKSSALNVSPPEGYTRLEHLPYQRSMGMGRAHDGELVIHHLDVLDSFIKQEVGTSSPQRIKLLTGIGQSMMPAIQNNDIVFVDVEHRWIDVPGYYVIDVNDLLLLKKSNDSIEWHSYTS